MYVFQVPTSFSFEILSCICQQQIILISHDNKNCFDIFFFVAKTRSFRFHYDAFTMEFIFFPESPDKIFCTESTRFPADIYTGFLFKESESLTQSRLLLPEGKNVVLMQLSFAYFRDYGGLDTRKC